MIALIPHLIRYESLSPVGIELARRRRQVKLRAGSYGGQDGGLAGDECERTRQRSERVSYVVAQNLKNAFCDFDSRFRIHPVRV